ncbi:MAG: TonB-dependent receptor [Steroidobacteraceae bacterium]
MYKLYACSLSMLVTVVGIAPASAQSTTPEADALQLEEIVVTAEKRETNLQKTALSIQVYSGEDLKKEGKKRIDEIMNGVVGVQSQGSQVGTDFYMRGVGNVGGMGGGERAVAVLIDGVYQNRTETVRGGTLDVAQVEVMRGTQSTTLGASSLAGAVSLVSNQPVFEYQASGSLEVGNYHLLNTEGVLNVPLSDSQALRFAYSSNKRDGYISSGAGDSDLTNARLKYRWHASDDLDAVFTVNHQNIGGNGVSDGVLLYSGHWAPWTTGAATLGDSDGMGGVTARAGGCASTATTMGCPALFYVVSDGVTYQNRSNPWDDGYPADAWPNNPYRNTNIDTLSADINWTTGLGILTVKPSVQKAHFLSTEPPRGTSFRAEDSKQHTEQLDAQLASQGTTLQWLAGAYYYNTDTSGTFKTVLFPGANDMGTACPGNDYCYTWTDTRSNPTKTLSVYGNATYPVVDTFRVLGGVRYSKDKKSIDAVPDTSAVFGTISGPSSAYSYRSNSHEWSATTYRVGAEYDLRPESMAYATYSTGYQPGSVAVDSFTKEQKIEQIALGLKNRFFDGSVQVNVELFDSTYHNRSLQGGLTVTVDESITNNGNCSTGSSTIGVSGNLNVLCFASNFPVVDDYTSRGVDLETSWLPTAADRIDVSVEYLKATQSAPDISYVTESALSALGVVNTAAMVAKARAQAAAYDGLPTQNSPEWSGNLTYQHNFRFAGGSTLTPKVNMTYKSEYWSAGGPNANATTAMNHNSPLWQDAYSLWNAYLTWQNADGKFTVSGNVKNIENKPIMTNYGGTYVSLDAPRTFSVNFSANF